MIELKCLLERDPSPQEATSLLESYNLPYSKTVLINLKSIAQRLSGFKEFEAVLSNLLERIKGSAHPEQSLNHAERFFRDLPKLEEFLQVLLQDKKPLRILSLLFGASPYLSSIVIQNPELFLWLIEDPVWKAPLDRESLIEEIVTACEGIKDLHEAYPMLRYVKQREILRIGARDLTGFSDVTETTEGLTTLAEASLEAAYRVADRFMKMRYGTPLLEDETGQDSECRFTILGMGKLGGEELNFSSDIDLLFLYESDKGGTTGVSNATSGTQAKVDNHLYFVRLSEAITDLLHTTTEDGFVFRVDLRLRPEGSHGPVASSLRSYELYYESFGQTWERAALLKCRAVAGDLSLGKEFEEMLRPFIYRKYLDFAAIDEIREMKRRILQGLGQKPSRGVNVKLGRGGIREIEFFVQVLQLIYGGRITWIREKNSQRALHKLCDKKLITYEDFSALSKAYVFLRDVEHKLQIENQLQLQTLPRDKAKLGQLARRCVARSLEAFLKELDDHRESVQEIFETLFYEQEKDQPAEDSLMHEIARGMLEEGEVEDRLAGLGFQDPRQAHKNLEHLMAGSPYVPTSSRCRSLFLKVAPNLLDALASSPDPDMALNHLERFVSGYGARETFYELLAQNPPTLQGVVTLFSMSSYLSHLLIRHPDIIEMLFGEDLMRPVPTVEEICKSLMQGLSSPPAGLTRIDFLRRFKHLEEIKVGLKDILNNEEPMQTSQALSRLADACLQAAYSLALEELSSQYGAPQDPAGNPAEFAILGAGKLGSLELSYGSDLDLLFVYTENGDTSGPDVIPNGDFFDRLARRISALLTTMTAEGIVYRVDLRLRPLGEAGPLVQPLEGFREYFKRSLQPWERQALTRIRFCAGSKKAGEKLLSLVTETLYHSPPPPDLSQNILEMRLRIEKEKARPTEGLLFFKTGAGGLIDIEFLVQYLQLRYGHETKEIRPPRPLQVLETALNLGGLTKEDALLLKDAYLFLHRLESRTRIVQDRPITSLSTDPEKNRSLSLRMGYQGEAPGQQLLDDYHHITQKTREAFLRLLGGGESG